jgi:hypothetical protein
MAEKLRTNPPFFHPPSSLADDDLPLFEAGQDLNAVIAFDADRYVHAALAILFLHDDKIAPLERADRLRREPQHVVLFFQHDGHTGQVAQFQLAQVALQADTGRFVGIGQALGAATVWPG